ncbi:TOBE domain-containing protein, partial [Rhodococcus chondri]
GDCAHTPLGEVRLVAPGRGRGRVLVRPEQVEVEPAPDVARPGDPEFTVSDIAFGGAHSEVRVAGAGIAVRALRGAVHGLQVGEPVRLRVPVPVPFYG